MLKKILASSVLVSIMLLTIMAITPMTASAAGAILGTWGWPRTGLGVPVLGASFGPAPLVVGNVYGGCAYGGLGCGFGGYGMGGFAY